MIRFSYRGKFINKAGHLPSYFLKEDFKIVIIHHTDADGWLGAVICALGESDNTEEIKYIPFNYGTIDLDLIDRGEKVVCVDTSLNNNEESLNQWTDVFAKSQNVVFIDHHATTLDVLESIPDFFTKYNVDAFVSSKRSGAYLAYMYYFLNAKESLMDAVGKEIPLIVQMIDDFDRFELKISGSKEFVKSLDMYCVDPSTKEGFKFWKGYLNDAIFQNELPELMGNAKMYMAGLKTQWEKIRKSSLYTSTIRDGDGCYHTIAVINADGYSDMFDTDYKKYNVCCLWTLENDGYYHYSLYSDNKFDCKEFAERYGGGGHLGASGFKTKELLFVPEP